LIAVVGGDVTAHEGLGPGWWIMVAARVCARAYFFWFAYLFGSTISLVLLLSLWFDYLFGLALVVLPVVVRFDVARGTRGIVVRVNVARVLSVFSLISSRLRESCLYAGFAHGVWFPFSLFLTQPLFSPRPTKSATNNNNNASQTTKAFLRRLFFIF
jgi:hypothetical protein